MFASPVPATRASHSQSRSLLMLLGLLLILSPLAEAHAQPLRSAAPTAQLSAADRAAISSLLPASATTAITAGDYLKASNTEARDLFGNVLAIDGNTVVVGTWGEDSAATGVNGNQADNSASEAGAAYVFIRTGTTWSQQAYLKASNAEALNLFGSSVAINGDTIVVGAPYEDSAATGVNGNQQDNSAQSAGAAYVFTRTGTTWSQQAYLKAANTEAGDHFGSVVAINDDTIAVGAWNEASAATGINGNQQDNSAQGAGAVYVFGRTGTTWSQQAYLKASNTGAGDEFGRSLALSYSTLVVGASGEDSIATGVNGDQANNSAQSAGAAYVFRRTDTTWSQQAYLKASNTEAIIDSLYPDEFGSAVAINGDTIVVGAPYEDSAATGVNGDQANNNAEDAGAVYVFTRTNPVGTTWTQQAYLKASNTHTQYASAFGSSVAMDGNTIVVGAPDEFSAATGVDGNQADYNALWSGAAYVFSRSGPAWSQKAYLKASNTQAQDSFGAGTWTGDDGIKVQGLGISGNTIVAGSPLEDSAATGINGNQADNSADQAGAVYTFNIPTTVSISDGVVVEGDSGRQNAILTVDLNVPSSQVVTIEYMASDGTALGGSDYVISAGTIIINPGPTTFDIAVEVHGDTVDETDETFYVDLTWATGAILADDSGIVTIVNDDGMVNIFLPQISR